MWIQGRNLQICTHIRTTFNNITKIWTRIVLPTKVVEPKEVTDTKHADLVCGPKRKVALLFAYLGAGYHGLALNRGNRDIKTIEGALFEALIKAKVVPENCLEDPKKMCYKSASRTDKGVSTCGQVASLKLRIADNVVDLINSHLPANIVILGVKRTTQGFNAQKHAIGRTYSYTLPTYAFADGKNGAEDYHITPEKLKYISSIMYRFKGTHSYHNFTSGKKMGETSAKRYITDFYYEEPFLVEETQYMTCFIKGQSFMLHQIRKMMGLLIAMVSNHAGEDHYVRAFSEPLEDIPKAPGTGLVLQQIHYDAYNKKFGSLHGGIEFDAQQQQREFLKSKIMPSIYRENKENDSMRLWLETLENHDYTGEKARLQWQEINAAKSSSAISSEDVSKTETSNQNVETAIEAEKPVDTNVHSQEPPIPPEKNLLPIEDPLEPSAKKTKTEAVS
uniref:Pseudouridylate synthase 1 homolog n=1 Tax=Phallusia mammillata TaxID=59560 RepID=A0A6F9DQR2_9ASCI|nr:tRNA pseudouridine synthase A, mitochondrial [Phallusia mammillata]